MNKYKIIALIGEAGSGKDFLLRALEAHFPEAHAIVSCTTRPKRENEIDNIDYHFLSYDYFIELTKTGKMLEFADFNGWLYGTQVSALCPDKINIGIFNPEGIRNLLKRKDMIDLQIYYVRAPAKTRLLRQLNRENDPNVEEIIRRFQTDVKDFSNLDFDYINLPNETFDDILDAFHILNRNLSQGKKD